RSSRTSQSYTTRRKTDHGQEQVHRRRRGGPGLRSYQGRRQEEAAGERASRGEAERGRGRRRGGRGGARGRGEGGGRVSRVRRPDGCPRRGAGQAAQGRGGAERGGQRPNRQGPQL